VAPPGQLAAVDATSPANAWAVGDAGGQTLAERWEGAEWKTVATAAPGDSSRLFGVTSLASDDAWAVGSWDQGTGHHGLAEHWDGQSWTQVPNTSRGDLNAIDSDPEGGIWTVGAGPFLARWTGTTFKPYSRPASIEEGELHGVKVVGRRDAWAVGARETESGGVHDIALILRWNGRVWGLVTNPEIPGDAHELWAVDATGSNDVWAVGSQETDDGPRALILHSDGTRWTVIPAPNPGPAGDELFGVTATAPNDAWAVGAYDDGTTEHPLSMHWDGTSWKLVRADDAPGSPAADAFNAVSASGQHDLWAVGLQGPDDASLQPLMERAACQ
jgi:hypothetical protein